MSYYEPRADGTCGCPECTEVRKQSAIKASEKRAVDELKRLVGVADVKRAMSMLKINDAADAFYPVWAFGAGAGNGMAGGGNGGMIWRGDSVPFDGYTSNIDPTKTLKQEPKHKRKATKIVTKQAMNEPARMHADEAGDMIEEARDLLRAADAFDGMRIFDVVVPDEKQWNGKHAITIILEKIDSDEDTSLAEEFEDRTLLNAYKNGMVAVANRIRSTLQQSGRKLLLDATLSMHRLVAPEMAAAVAIEKLRDQSGQISPGGSADVVSMPTANPNVTSSAGTKTKKAA